MEQYGVQEARDKLSSLIDRVEDGEEVTITRHGKPVVKLVRAEDEQLLQQRTEAAERIKALRESLPKDTLKGLSIKQMIEEGRR